MSAYFYILRCKDQRHYHGITSDLLRRLSQHHRGQVISTRSRRPIKLIYFEEHETLQQARQRERSLKNHGMRPKALAKLIERFPQDRLAPFVDIASPG